MKKSFLILLILVTSSSLYLAYNFYQKKQAENELKTCIENILMKHEISNISVITNNRGKSPILTGASNKFTKNKVLNDINKSCQVHEIQDLIEKLNIPTNNNAFINFRIDAFNNVITIKGAFNNQKEFDDILKSFNDTFLTMSIQHDVGIDSKTNPTDFALDMTLLLPSIETIRVADISIKDDKLILNGIVRDQSTELQTLQTLHQLFDDKYSIVNELLQVTDKSERNEIKIDPLPMPKLQLPQLDR